MQLPITFTAVRPMSMIWSIARIEKDIVIIGEAMDGVEAVAGLRGDAQHRHARMLLADEADDLVDLLARQLIDAIEQDGVGLFELFLEDVRRLGGEARSLPSPFGRGAGREDGTGFTAYTTRG